jgi:hypothetical protein
MLSRKPTAIRLTQEDLLEYDILTAERSLVSSEGSPEQEIRKPTKGKEVATTAQDRQTAMDERIGVTNAGVRGTGR